MNTQQDIEKAKAPRRQKRAAGADFRVAFAQMADDAVIDRYELAVLLATTPGAISMLVFKGKLPPKAFSDSRRACWFVGHIRRYLASVMSGPGHRMSNLEPPHAPLEKDSHDRPRIGRRRNNTN